MPRSGRTLAALALAAAALPAPADAQESPAATVTLSPARAHGVAEDGVRVGPFGLRNGTTQPYDLRVFPVLLGQRRDGGLFVRRDGASHAAARRLMVASRAGGTFAPGATASASALVRRVPAGHSLYGGLLFQMTPLAQPGQPRQQIRQILRLNARVMLDPPSRLRRIRFAAEPIRAERAGPDGLALKVPVVNRGNTYVPVGGAVRVIDSGGEVVARERIRSVSVLPGATVEVTRPLTENLPAGTYSVRASLRADGRPFAATGSIELVGTGQVITRGARIASFAAPTAYRGHEGELTATFRNTGNVPFAPRALVRLRPAGPAGARRVTRTIEATAEEVAPGRTGEIRASFRVPADAGPFEATTEILDGRRKLDERTVSVTPTNRPALKDRLAGFVTEHAIWLVAGLLLLLAGGAAGGLAYLRRLRGALLSAEARPAAPSRDG